MKKLFNLFATILAVSVLTIGFASCANDSSDSSSSRAATASSSTTTTNTTTASSTGATFSNSEDKGAIDSWTEKQNEGFKRDNNVDLSAYVGKKIDIKRVISFVFAESTWEEKEGDVLYCEGKEIANPSKVKGKGTYTTTSGNFTDGVLALTQTHGWDKENKKLKEESNTASITIAGGKFTLGSTEYTKQ